MCCMAANMGAGKGGRLQHAIKFAVYLVDLPELLERTSVLGLNL